MSNVTNDGSKIDRQLALTVLPIAFVAGMAFILYQATFPHTVQITVCEKVAAWSSLSLLDGSTMEVSKPVYDSLSPLTTYVVEDRWFHEPVFMDLAAEQEGYRCRDTP